jgi:hypothetical protein
VGLASDFGGKTFVGFIRLNATIETAFINSDACRSSPSMSVSAVISPRSSTFSTV